MRLHKTEENIISSVLMVKKKIWCLKFILTPLSWHLIK